MYLNIKKTNIIILIISILFSQITPVFGQENDKFTIQSSFKVSTSTINYYSDKLKSLNPTFNQKNKVISKFQEICEKRGEYLIDLNNDDQLMDSCEIVEFAQEITNFLVESNPNIFNHSSYKVFLRRSSVINASNLGEGIIMLNIGLIARVKTLEQLAFVIAHELSHDVKKHVLELTENNALVSTDKSFNKEYKSAANQKYGSYTERQRIAYGMIASMNHHSRNNELVADSLGYVICSNAGIEKIHAVELLEILDKSDELAFSDSIDLKTFFSSQNYEIKEEDLTQPDLYGAWKQSEKLFVRPDSLKTHPDCEDRILFLEQITPFLNNAQNDKLISLNKRWSVIQEVFLYEYIHTLLEEENISEAHYYAICLKLKGYDTPFINSVISYCFLEYFEGIKNHNFARKVAFPDHKYNNGYNKFLEFLHAQNSKKFLTLYKAYFNKNITKDTNVEFVEFISEYAFYLENKSFTSSKIESNYFKHPLYSLKIETLTINK